MRYSIIIQIKREEEAEEGKGGQRDKGNKNREGRVEIYKPRASEKGSSQRSNNNARMGRALHEIAEERKVVAKTGTETKRK
jgi:hypothetical protein